MAFDGIDMFAGRGKEKTKKTEITRAFVSFFTQKIGRITSWNKPEYIKNRRL